MVARLRVTVAVAAAAALLYVPVDARADDGVVRTSSAGVSADGKIDLANSRASVDPADDVPPEPAVQMSPCNGGCSSWVTETTTPTFTASAPVEGRAVGYRFEVQDSQGTAVTDAPWRRHRSRRLRGWSPWARSGAAAPTA